MKVEPLFTEDDLEAIRRATAEAELRTSGEIVPYLVGRVDDHDEGRWRGAAFGAVFASLAAGLAHALGDLWGGYGLTWITLPTLTGAGLGFLLAAWIPPLERALLSADDLDRRVRRRAEAAFLEEEVFSTRDRTGILVFLALFERRAVILGDTGIHEKVDPGTWQTLVDDLVAGLREGRPAASLAETIRRCGVLLAEHGVERRSDDVDELSDAPRIRER